MSNFNNIIDETVDYFMEKKQSHNEDLADDMASVADMAISAVFNVMIDEEKLEITPEVLEETRKAIKKAYRKEWIENQDITDEELTTILKKTFRAFGKVSTGMHHTI